MFFMRFMLEFYDLNQASYFFAPPVMSLYSKFGPFIEYLLCGLVPGTMAGGFAIYFVFAAIGMRISLRLNNHGVKGALYRAHIGSPVILSPLPLIQVSSFNLFLR